MAAQRGKPMVGCPSTLSWSKSLIIQLGARTTKSMVTKNRAEIVHVSHFEQQEALKHKRGGWVWCV
jgi:hypothetical protein